MKISFFTPSYGVTKDFGAATFGFAKSGAENERDSRSLLFEHKIKGIQITGTYEEILNNIPEGDYKLAIVLLGNAGGENEFVHALADKTNLPLVGGGAAINPVSGESGLITGKSQAAVLFVDDERYDFEILCENIHYDILSEHEISFTDKRKIDAIDGYEPCKWLKLKKNELGLDADDFEHLTFADKHGINAHLSCVDGKIRSGRDLNEKMYLRYASADKVQERMHNFYDDKDAIVFGCAGLKGILHQNLDADGLGLFMFGEVCTKDGVSEFGNLMLSKLRICK